MADFEGFGRQGLPFLKALGFHQDRDWFAENKHLYESELRVPMGALIADLNEGFAKAGVPLKGDEKKSVFRINRDIRFSKDKRPYNTHISAVFTRSGTKEGHGILYIHVTPSGIPASWERMPEGSFMAAGFHQPSPEVLEALRRAVAKDPEAYLALVKKLAGKKLALGGESLTRLPRGFEDHKGSPVEAAIRQKSFMVEEKIPDAVLTSPKLVAEIVDFAKRAEPLLRFGWDVLPEGTA